MSAVQRISWQHSRNHLPESKSVDNAEGVHSFNDEGDDGVRDNLRSRQINVHQFDGGEEC